MTDKISNFCKINKGICPECGRKLDSYGSCEDCYTIPALDPEFQKWLNGTDVGVAQEVLALHIPTNMSIADGSYWLGRANELKLAHQTIEVEFVK